MKTILVVDDDSDICLVLAATLEMAGYRVLCAADGNRAIEVLSAESGVDLILLDLMLPGMSGWEILGKLRARSETAGTPVVLISAASSLLTPPPDLPRPAVAFITKPFDPGDLTERIAAILARSSSGSATKPSSP